VKPGGTFVEKWEEFRDRSYKDNQIAEIGEEFQDRGIKDRIGRRADKCGNFMLLWDQPRRSQ
jgi:hypothetical protein